MQSTRDLDVIIIGAGISGINAGYRVQDELPGASYSILEARSEMGGTWSLFKYPGIRSDSDLYTFGFQWRPWPYEESIAEASKIKSYLEDSAAEFGIDKHIRLNHKVQDANWSDKLQRWTLKVEQPADPEKPEGSKTTSNLTARFLIYGTGYYDYNEPLKTEIPGIDNFKGQTIHPQFWPEDLDYAGKKMVIVGSGATAVTLLPNVAKEAGHVTMLQRSPGYIVPLPQEPPSDWLIRKILPQTIARKVVRIKWIVFLWLSYNFLRTFPKVAKRALGKRSAQVLPDGFPMDPHFKPSYNPWDQRLCAAPEGDFHQAFHRPNVSIVTDHIEKVEDKSILLKSGERLDADIIVTATGLKLQLAGGSKIRVNGNPVTFSQKFFWHGLMMQDVPNAFFVIGYVNASWTLGADVVARTFTRIVNKMRTQSLGAVRPSLNPDEGVQQQRALNLSSTYIKLGEAAMPKAGDRGPWKARSSYLGDLWTVVRGNIDEGSGLQYDSAQQPM